MSKQFIVSHSIATVTHRVPRAVRRRYAEHATRETNTDAGTARIPPAPVVVCRCRDSHLQSRTIAEHRFTCGELLAVEKVRPSNSVSMKERHEYVRVRVEGGAVYPSQTSRAA